MPLTPGTLPRHELVGLDVEVVSASNPDFLDTSGEVVVETTRMLGVEESAGRTQSGDAPRVCHVPKADATFAFELPAGSENGSTVTVEGERLVARPARRTEQQGDSKWR